MRLRTKSVPTSDMVGCVRQPQAFSWLLNWNASAAGLSGRPWRCSPSSRGCSIQPAPMARANAHMLSTTAAPSHAPNDDGNLSTLDVPHRRHL